MVELLFIVASLLLVLACSVFVAAEFAFVTVDKARIQKLANNGDKQAEGVLKALKSLSTQLSGAQIGITITNLGIGFLAQPAVAQLLRGPLTDAGLSGTLVTTISIALAITIATIITMLFGELVPKNLAIARPVETAKAVQGLQRGFSKLMYYPILFMNGTANKIIRRFNIEPQEELASARSVEELMSVVQHSAKRGTLAKDTAILVERSLMFSERSASDVMTPRVRLEVVHSNEMVTDVIEAVKRSGFSRFPVIDGEIDNVVGMVSVKDAVAVPYEQRGATSISAVMQEVNFVPSSIELDTLIEKMRDEGIEATMTIDEYGGIDGIVTLEDLIEELVGEVKDEHDESGIAIRQLGKQSWSVSGLLRQDEIGHVTGVMLPEDEEYETIGGLVLDQLDEVPEVGDNVTALAVNRSGQRLTVSLTVTKMDGRRIDRIEISVNQGVKP